MLATADSTDPEICLDVNGNIDRGSFLDKGRGRPRKKVKRLSNTIFARESYLQHTPLEKGPFRISDICIVLTAPRRTSSCWRIDKSSQQLSGKVIVSAVVEIYHPPAARPRNYDGSLMVRRVGKRKPDGVRPGSDGNQLFCQSMRNPTQAF